jgi:hypothetical protein
MHSTCSEVRGDKEGGLLMEIMAEAGLTKEEFLKLLKEV